MFIREFKINLKSLILWIVILLLMFGVVFAVYPSIISSENKEMINQMLEVFPEEMMAMFNMDIVTIDSAYGWLKTEGYVFLTLLGGIYATILGATILLKEENDKTIEFLYSKPISRNKIIIAKILCGVINILIFTGVITLFNYVGLSMLEDIDVKQYLMLALIPLLLYFMLFFILMFVSTFLKKTKTAMGIGIGFVFINYLMQIVGGMSDKVSILKDISFFEFVSSRYIILNNSIDIKYLVIGCAIILMSIIGTFVKYNKKELVI